MERAKNNPRKKLVNHKQQARTPFKLLLNIQGDYRDINFNIFEENLELKKRVLDTAIDQILITAPTKKNYIEVCEINDSGYIICIERKDWKPLLEDLKNNYIIEEKYEDCVNLQKIIDSL
jgi:hypothetical protein